jgi:hypothetical protein
MNKDNGKYLKLFGGGGSNRQKRWCLFSKKAKVTAIRITVVILFVLGATFCDFAAWNTVSYHLCIVIVFFICCVVYEPIFLFKLKITKFNFF